MTRRRTPSSKRIGDEPVTDADLREPEDLEAEDLEAEQMRGDEAGMTDDEAVSGDDALGSPEAGDDPRTLKDRWLRAEADLQNFRRRATREREESRRAAEEGVVLDVISVMDDLDRAIDAARAAGVEGAWIEGFELVATRLRDTLGRRGIQQMDPLGMPFDPEFHEALLETEAPEGAAPGDVVQVVLKGYQRDGRALRAARVVVARAPVKGA